jgi:outer membrane protein W
MKTKFLIGALASLFATAGALAQSAGSVVVYGGAAQINPQVDSGDLTAPSLAGTKVDVKKASPTTGPTTSASTCRSPRPSSTTSSARAPSTVWASSAPSSRCR